MRDSFGKAGTGREMPCSKAIVDANPCSTENPTDSSMPMESDETSETCQQVHAHCCPARCRRSRGSDKAAADLPAGVSQTAVPGAHQSCANPQGLADLETEPEEEFDLPSDDIFAEAEDDDVFNEEIVYDTVFNPPVCGSEKGSSDQRGKRTSTKTKSIVYDTRTEELMVKPGNAVDWSLDIDLATRLPTAFAHTLKKKAVKRAGAQRAYAAAAAGSKQDLKREFFCMTVDVKLHRSQRRFVAFWMMCTQSPQYTWTRLAWKTPLLPNRVPCAFFSRELLPRLKSVVT